MTSKSLRDLDLENLGMRQCGKKAVIFLLEKGSSSTYIICKTYHFFHLLTFYAKKLLQCHLDISIN